MITTKEAIKGRGALTNQPSRYLASHSEYFDAELEDEEWAKGFPQTELILDHAKSIITTNKSPDIPFDQSINPYKGCEHGCIYCFARPTHAYWDLSPGLDFETKILYKPEGPDLLERAINKASYVCKPIAFGTNTDPYQPVDQQLQITRQLLQVLQRYRHPFTLVTKGSHVLRDLDIFTDMAADNLCSVRISVTTLSNELKRVLEPRAASVGSRLKTIKILSGNKVPVGILMAPIIPMINDMEIEDVIQASAEAGAQCANHIFIRLPLEVKELFHEWLHQHFPKRAKHVINLIRQSRNGADNSSEYGTRMRGTGVFADLIAKRFALTCERFGLVNSRNDELTMNLFRKSGETEQLNLF
jgi:DNA repair photolyase